MVSHWGWFIHALSLPHQQLRTTPSKGRGLLAVVDDYLHGMGQTLDPVLTQKTIRPCDFRPPQVNFRYAESAFFPEGYHKLLRNT